MSLLHCTSKEMNSAITAYVRNSCVIFLVAGISVRAIPNLFTHKFKKKKKKIAAHSYSQKLFHIILILFRFVWQQIFSLHCRKCVLSDWKSNEKMFYTFDLFIFDSSLMQKSAEMVLKCFWTNKTVLIAHTFYVVLKIKSKHI